MAREVGAPLPFDFGLGRPLLGDLEREVGLVENPFLCSRCAVPLDEKTVEKIRVAAPYDNIPVETRCTACRAKGVAATSRIGPDSAPATAVRPRGVTLGS